MAEVAALSIPLPGSGQKSSARIQSHLPLKAAIICWSFHWLWSSLPWCQCLVPVSWPVAMSITAAKTVLPSTRDSGERHIVGAIAELKPSEPQAETGTENDGWGEDSDLRTIP